MGERVHNFSAGPAALPIEVLEQVKDELLDFQGTGTSILEASHRGKAYSRVHQEAMDDLKALLSLGDDHSVIFMGGGARSQFALVAMNLLADGFGAYVNTGRWSDTAIAEAGKVGDVREIWSSADTGYDHVPAASDLPPAPPGAAYLHTTSNNTVAGTEFLYDPAATGAPLVCDMSSDLLSRRVDVSGYGLIYAGAQKNLGPAGVTLVIARADMLERSAGASLPAVFSYAQQAAKRSLLNTPPVFPIYVVGLVLKRLRATGGLAATEAMAKKKSGMVYGAIDTSGGFYTGLCQVDSRSRMNVTFRTPSPELDARFLEHADAAALIGLKGHRSVGGLRASIYNSVPRASVETLCEFMGEFQRTAG